MVFVFSKQSFFLYALLACALLKSPANALSSQAQQKKMQVSTRRDFFSTAATCSAIMGSSLFAPQPASAAADCFGDCLKNCKLIAPKDPAYCMSNCKDYCAQEDRTDGLSGSVSAASGEVGILGGTFGQGTVPKGDDKPPSISLPGLDFNSEKGKALLGYK